MEQPARLLEPNNTDMPPDRSCSDGIRLSSFEGRPSVDQEVRVTAPAWFERQRLDLSEEARDSAPAPAFEGTTRKDGGGVRRGDVDAAKGRVLVSQEARFG